MIAYVFFSSGMLYKHFVDKEDMFLAVIQENLPDVVATVHEEWADKGTVGDNLVEMARAIIHYYEQLIPLFSIRVLLPVHGKESLSYDRPVVCHRPCASSYEECTRIKKV